MTRIAKWHLVVLVVFASAAWLQAQDTGTTEQAVASLEEKWMQGQKTNNPDMIAPLLADNMVSMTSDGNFSPGRTRERKWRRDEIHQHGV